MRLTPALAAALLAFVLATAAQASVAIRASVEDLAESSDVVIEGVVAESASAWDDGRAAIWTTHRVVVRRTLAGAGEKEVRVRVRGGRVGDVVQESPGGARLAAGERVVLFLGADGGSGREVVGLAQGAFEVRTDPGTGATTAESDLDGLTLVDAHGTPAPAGAERFPLADLERRVATGRARAEARARASRERVAKTLARWRELALRYAPALRGRPGGLPR